MTVEQMMEMTQEIWMLERFMVRWKKTGNPVLYKITEHFSVPLIFEERENAEVAITHLPNKSELEICTVTIEVPCPTEEGV